MLSSLQEAALAVIDRSIVTEAADWVGPFLAACCEDSSCPDLHAQHSLS